MALNRTNMLTDSTNPKLARIDINDMFADLGYGASGSVSPITTTGEAGKLVKMSSAGNMSITQLVNGSVGVMLNNTSTGVNANTGFQAKGNNLNYLSAWSYGSGRTSTIFGKTMGSYSALLAQGADNAGLLLGTISTSPLVIGTNGVERYNINSNGVHTFTTPATTSYNAIFRNTSYATTDTSATSSIKIGYSNHDGVKIEAYKDTAFNISGIKFYGEYGIGTEKLLLNLKSSDGSANFSGNVIVNNGTGDNALLGLTSNSGLLSLKNSSSVENIRLDSSTVKVKIGNATSTELNATTWQDSRLSVYDSIGIQNNATLAKSIFFTVGSTIDSLNMINLVRQSGDTIFKQGIRSDGNALVFGDSGIERLVLHKQKFIDYVEEGINGKLYVGRYNGTASSPTSILSGDVVGTFGTKGQYGTTKYQHAIGGVISFVATGNYVSTTNAPTDLVVSLATTSSGATEKLRLTSAGNLKLSSLAGTGNRMVVADATGNLSASGSIGISSDGTVNFITNEIKVKPTTTLSLVAGTWYNVCASPASQPNDVIMVNLACFISSGNNHSALIAVSKCSGFYQSATTLASSSTGLIPTYTFRFNAGFLQIAFNATNLPSNFNCPP